MIAMIISQFIDRDPLLCLYLCLCIHISDARVKRNNFVVIDQSDITANNEHSLLIWLNLRMTVIKWDDISTSNMMISCRCCIRLNYLNTVRYPYNAANCLPNPHNRHSTCEIWCSGSNVSFAIVIAVSYVIS